MPKSSLLVVICRAIAKHKLRFALGYGTAGMAFVPFLVAREVQRMCVEYWNVNPPLALLLPLGVIVLWTCGSIYFRFVFPHEVGEQWENNPAFKKLKKGQG